MLKTDKILRLKTKKGRLLNVVREHYLRDDIPCHSGLCGRCDHSSLDIQGTVLLSPDLTHYVVPDCQVTKSYLEIFEFPEIQGVLFFQTVFNHIQHSGSRKLLTRLKNVVKDTRQQCSVFSNEFCDGAYSPRRPGERLESWQARCIYSSILWYYTHLEQRIPVVMVTDSKEAVDLYSNKTIGIFVMTLDDYLTGFYSNCTEIRDLYDSLSAVIAESSKQISQGTFRDYKEYLSLEVLEAGIKSGRFYKGCLNVNKHNAQMEAFVQKQSESVSSGKDSRIDDILIHGMVHRNRAVHGDVVVIEMLPKSQWKARTTALKRTGESNLSSGPEKTGQTADGDVTPSGHVVGVLQRNWRDYAVTFAEDEHLQGQRRTAGKVLVVPWDYRIPKIRISTRQLDALRDQRFIVRIDSWEVDSMYPNGHFVRALGDIGDLDTEVATLMVENSLSAPPFTDGQLKELPSNTTSAPWEVDDEEIGRRRDLRSSHLVFSIDPKGCEDVDDTLSVRKLKNGNLELGVHIADVTYFVHPGSLTDAEARSRSTTVYLADRRYDMLPEILSADLCSLISGVDRYAMSVMWVLDSNYDVIKTWYGRTVIRSSYKLFYEAAQAIADGQVADEEVIQDIPELQDLSKDLASARLDEIRWSVRQLMDIARHLKARRSVEGAVELEGVEVQVQLGDKKDIRDLVPKQPLEVHETIAECMIFANHWVAKKIAHAFPTAALLRRHPLPRQQQFSSLINCAQAKGFSIQTRYNQVVVEKPIISGFLSIVMVGETGGCFSSSNKILADSLDKCVDEKDPSFNKILRTLATQAMSNAVYFSTGSISPDEFFHYGLALDRYTHFTSPIRRYADVIVHRLLMAAVETGDKPQLLQNEALEELAQHINNKHRAAQNVQRDSVELFQALFFQDLKEDDERRVTDAVIFNIRANGLLVFIPRYGFKGAVYLKDKSGQVVTPVTLEDSVTYGPGSLVHHEFDVQVQNSAGLFTFRLFDHIQVKISVAKSRAHAQSLRLDLTSLKTRSSPPPGEVDEGDLGTKMKRNDLVKEVKSIQEDRRSQATSSDERLDSNFAELKTKYGQTNSHVSLYCLLEYFRELSLLDT